MQRFSNLLEISKTYPISFDVNSYKYENIILDIYNSAQQFDINKYDLTNSEILNILGVYYQYEKQDYNEMKKYFLMAIELNNNHSMHNLAKYYETTEKNILK